MKEFVLLFFLVSGSNGQLPKANTFFENLLEAEKELEDRGNSQYSGFQSKAASVSARWAAAVQKLNDDFAEQAKLAKTGIEKLVATKTEHDAKKFQKEQEFLDVLKEAILTLNNTDLFAQTMAKHKEKQDKMTDLWKQWWEAKQEKKQKDLEYYLCSLDTIHQKWTEWQTKWNDAVTNNWEKQKEKYAAAKKEFDELKTMAKNELIKRKAEKQARKDKLKRKLVDSKNEVETKKEELEALQQDFFAQMRVIAEKKQEVTSLIDQFLSEEASYFWENLLHDKKQEDLNKVAYQKAVWDTLTGHNLAEPVAKATMLDQITGASGWRTATWVLLSISIVISVALVGLIVYTIQQHKHYERLGDVAIAPNQGVFFDYSKTNNGAAGYASTSASAPVALY